MKILWFTNIPIADKEITGSGTWLTALGQQLSNVPNVELHNVTTGNEKNVVHSNLHNIDQWLVPPVKRGRNGLPSHKIIKMILEIVNTIQPDLIHIWGTEHYWGLLTARKIIQGTVLLDMQGLLYSVANVFYGNLSLMEMCHCISIKEILKPSVSIFASKHELDRLSRYEQEIIQGHTNISVQSDWVKRSIQIINPHANIINTQIALRAEFGALNTFWAFESNRRVIFTTSSPISPNKGIHDLIKTVAILKLQHPNVVLRIAGYIPQGIKKPGYTRFVQRLIKQYNLHENVVLCGNLNAQQLILELTQCSVAVVPSYVESYSMAIAEAMAVGTPVIATYAGAMPEFSDKGFIRYYSPGDYTLCASIIEDVFNNAPLGRIPKRLESLDLSLGQLSIYNAIISKNN
ncbi:MAG: glycosyltransferase [Muribaculaceae bacterium]